MKGFDARFLDELKSKNDIVDTISKYVHLEQKGGNYWGRCPFHHEKTPSFCVNPQGQFFYCFGCHKSGDVITFVRAIESIDFADAVKILADKAKMPIPEMKYDEEQLKEQKQKKERLLSLLKDTARYYVNTLRTDKAESHIDYINKRKFTSDTIVKFGLGASLDFNSLPKYLKEKGYTYQEMVESGTCGEKNGRYFDWLGGRLIIPVIDQFNNVVAFDGRRIDGGKEQKYINTKETQIFFKGKTLFNINNLKKVKNEKGIDSVIIVEGHLDVVSLVQAGIENVVASMGTALTKDQARILKRYADKVYISYDGDSAGQKNTLRGIDILSDEGLEVKIISLPDGLDPDDVIKQYGADYYRQLILEAKPLIDFKLDSLKKTFDLKTVDGKRKYAQNACRIIRESSSPTEQEDLLKIVRDNTGFTFESLKRELYQEENVIKEQNSVPKSSEHIEDKNKKAIRFILYSYLFNKEYTLDTNIEELEFSLSTHKEIADYIISKKKENAKCNFSDLYEILADDQAEELNKLAELETDTNSEGRNIAYQENYFNDCVKTVKTSLLEEKIQLLTSRFKAETDENVRRQIAVELQSLLTKKNKLN
ncbi:MAG: DNA primase [Clostridia bacterium]|nr:DNA primase [Clostridia bacterium]